MICATDPRYPASAHERELVIEKGVGICWLLVSAGGQAPRRDVRDHGGQGSHAQQGRRFESSPQPEQLSVRPTR